MSNEYDPDSVDRSIIKTRMAPAAIGPYSQGLFAGNTLYCSGQIGIDPETGKLVEGSIEDQTERVLENLGAVLHAAGLSYENVVRCTVYLTDIDDYAAVNEIYARYFSETPPVRDALQVAALPREARVEISCIAVR